MKAAPRFSRPLQSSPHMRRLILLRHAKTETDAPTGEDQDRRLDDRGRNDAAGIGGWLAQNQLCPDDVLVSSATRAQQTWEIISAQNAAVPRVVSLPELYGAGPSQLLEIIRAGNDNADRLLIVGHNPGLHELALALVGSGQPADRKALQNNMPTSGLVVIDFKAVHWDDLSFGAGQLSHYVSPKLLKERG
jgi:phosphohistidine phosphatase